MSLARGPLVSHDRQPTSRDQGLLFCHQIPGTALLAAAFSLWSPYAVALHPLRGGPYLPSFQKLVKATEHFRIIAACLDAGESAINEHGSHMPCRRRLVSCRVGAEGGARARPHNYMVGHLEIGCMLFWYDPLHYR